LVKLKGFQKLTPVDEALRKFLAAINFKPLKKATVPVSSALNRILAENITAQTDLPRFNRSAVDGYALKANETVGASQFKPKTFKLTKISPLDSVQTRQVWTGNMLPQGADAVVMLEETRLIKDKVEIWTQVASGENVSKKGEELQKGEVAIEKSTRLKPQHLGLIATLGVDKIRVYDKPKVGVLATGNELVELGNKPKQTQIFESNRLVLSTLCSELGAEPVDLGIVGDDLEDISERLKLGLTKSDFVITSGGTSVGGLDLVPEAANRVAKPGIIVHGVALRPGMPTALATADGKPILILPGNPVAAIVGFEVFGRPVVCKMLGMKQSEPRVTLQAKMTRRVATALGRRNFVRVHVFRRDGQVLAEPVSARGSGLLSTMTRANGYVIVPENREGLEEQELVSVQLFDIVED
jgi:molybdopterin molybdotransferase